LDINKNILKEFNLSVGQAFEFYKLIGKEDENLLKKYSIKNKENIEDKE